MKPQPTQTLLVLNMADYNHPFQMMIYDSDKQIVPIGL